MTRRKPTPNPLPRATTQRSTAPAREAPGSAYASILDRARAMGLFAVVAIAPLGAMAGSVVACGGARPVDPKMYNGGPPGYVPPMETIAPPAASASTTPPPGDDQ